jgi:hypothetical protein
MIVETFERSRQLLAKIGAKLMLHRVPPAYAGSVHDK